uniref:NADH-ubiquinone oxidoreductase chain 6 n=1 Tax=Coleoptera sp. 9 KM-2017 TaxID=2219343 RepID=A0A346RGG5_9COLE|nr:NADH dehydrogenase subunit 6 [Coleoptera sp. 9 KM-2017]
MIILYYNLFLMSFFMMLLNHPLSLGLILLMQTINISLLSGSLSLNFWYSYMLFLIMIGGMLVLFLYMTNVASNEKFKFSPIMLLLSMSIFIMIIYLIMFNSLDINITQSNYMNINYYSLLNFKNSMSKYFSLPYIFNYMMIIIYLFITLIAVVKITNIKYGPLRIKN